jgi:hypothetical protein
MDDIDDELLLITKKICIEMIDNFNINIKDVSSDNANFYKSNLTNFKDEIDNSLTIGVIISKINNMKSLLSKYDDIHIFLELLNSMKIICENNKKSYEITNKFVNNSYMKNLNKEPYEGGSKCKLNKTNDKIKIIYNKKKYERTIYINKNNKKFVKINNKQLELSKLKKV